MTKRYTTLRKRLEDLEAQLETLFSFPPENPAPEAFVDKVSKKLAFLGRLLDAEVASRPSKPRHLVHISRRFDKLSHDFHAWLDDGAVVGDDDADKTCSCTESCLNDDGDAEVFEPEGTEIVEYHAETASLRDWHEEEQFSDCLGAEKAEKEARIVLPRGRNRRVGVLKVVGFVCLIVVVMLFGWSEYASRDEHFDRFLVPT